MICSLTGMDAANASVYDGASAAAEAVGMCRAPGKRMKALVSSCAHPMTHRDHSDLLLWLAVWRSS